MIYSIADLKAQFETYAKANNFDFSPKELYEPLDYILSMGGKRMRPVLLMMACNLFADNIEKSLPSAYGIELFHNFSLMHDDIMDKAPLRRGKPTVHKAYNTNTAILSGDAMLIYSYKYIAQVPATILAKALDIFNATCLGVCEGQQMDTNFEQRTRVEFDTYLKMITLKTAVLLDGAMQIGALIGGASDADAKHMGEFGRYMGILFQIQDDYLDTFGTSAKVGKRIGGDILQNKKTFLVIKALEEANSDVRAKLDEWMASEVEASAEQAKIDAVTTIFKDLDIPKIAQNLMETYYDKAIACLEAIQVEDIRKAPLKAFLNQIYKREQ